MPKGDLIATVLRHEIEQFRLDNFASFELHVLIQPISRANPIIDADGNRIGFDEYAFDQWSRPPKAVKVALSRSGPRVWYMKEWRPVSYLLKHLTTEWNAGGDSSTSNAMQLQWEQQARWWLANGKKFPLLELPAELRKAIYGYVFGAVVRPYPTAKARRLGPSTYNTKRPNYNLLQTCQLVHKEANEMLFQSTPFLVEYWQILQKLTDSELLRSSIRKLDIALSHEGFLILFREYVIHDNGDVVAHRSRAAMALKHMELTKLRLTIAPPSAATNTGTFDGACQKAAVEWILKAAWPFVRGHPVELTGFVKTSQKAAFEEKCEATRADFEEWKKGNTAAGLPEGSLTEYLQEIDEDGGVLLDEEKGAQKEEHKVEHPELHCRCKVRCTLRQWTADD